MGARSISSGIITFGLVTIPYKLYVAASEERISFNYICPDHNVKLKQLYKCPIDNKVIERADMARGYEFSKDHFVVFSNEDIEKIQGENTHTIDIKEFVPFDTFDQIQIEKTYYIAPNKGGDKAIILFAETMNQKDLIAVGKWANKGKDQLVVLRPYRGGLILHQLFYHNEVREFNGVPVFVEPSANERQLASDLIDTLTNEAFDPKAYHDEYAQRAHEAVEQKVAGKDISIAPTVSPATVGDLFDALQNSIKEANKKGKKKAPAKKTRSTKKKAAKKKKAS